MAPKKKNILPSVEIIIVLIFFLSFIVWAASKCNATKDLYQEQAIEELKENTVSNTPADESPSATAPPPNSATSTDGITPSSGVAPLPTNPTPATTSPNSPALTTSRSTVFATKLYVSIDGMNMRRAPHLDSAVIVRMSLFEELTFMNEVTDSTQIISLGDEIANEPWVKVKNKKGHIGWVYGAGVHYYKRKRE